MKRFSIKTFSAFFIAVCITLTGVATPAFAGGSSSITPSIFAAGVVVPTSITLNYLDDSPSAATYANLGMQALYLPSSCTASPTTNFSDCGVTSITVNGSPAAANTQVSINNLQRNLKIIFPAATVVSTLSVQFMPNQLTAGATAGSYGVIWQLPGGNSFGIPNSAFTVTSQLDSVAFDASGGSGSMANVTGVGVVTLPMATFTRTGFAFGGWASAPGGTTVAVTDGGPYTLSGNTTLYAIWSANSNGGSSGGAGGGSSSGSSSSASSDTGLANTGLSPMPYLLTSGVLILLGFSLILLYRPHKARR